MKPTMLGIMIATFPGAAVAQIDSAYTQFDRDRDCALVARAPGGESDWAHFVCPGWKGYPFVIRYGDVRETITYGFAAGNGMPGILPFNAAHDTVEWRLRADGEARYPVAAIQRWFVADASGDIEAHQILVVSKVGAPGEGDACAIAFLSATGNPAANREARRIADERAQSFDCGLDSPWIEESIAGMISGRVVP